MERESQDGFWPIDLAGDEVDSLADQLIIHGLVLAGCIDVTSSPDFHHNPR